MGDEESAFNGNGASVLQDEKRSGDGRWRRWPNKENVLNAATRTLKNG